MTPTVPPAIHTQVMTLAARLTTTTSWWEFDNIVREIVLARDKMKSPNSLFNSRRFMEDEE